MHVLRVYMTFFNYINVFDVVIVLKGRLLYTDLHVSHKKDSSLRDASTAPAMKK